MNIIPLSAELVRPVLGLAHLQTADGDEFQYVVMGQYNYPCLESEDDGAYNSTSSVQPKVRWDKLSQAILTSMQHGLVETLKYRQRHRVDPPVVVAEAMQDILAAAKGEK